MSIQSSIADITHSFGDAVNNALNQAKASLSQINGYVTTSLSTVWDGGFAGISRQGVYDVKTALEIYIASVQSIIDEFNPEGDISVALAGTPKDAAMDFIKSVKELLQAYVSTMRGEKDEIEEAYENYTKQAQNISSQVVSDADQIRQNAADIKID